MKVYQAIARALEARESCIKYRKEAVEEKNFNKYNELVDMWDRKIERIEEQFLPHGSGFDTGETINVDESSPDKIVIYGEFHVMNEVGIYDGYAGYKIVVVPSLAYGFDLKLVGSSYWPSRTSYVDLQDYIETIYQGILDNPIEWRDLAD
jgi:hypothetical protein